MVDFIKISPVAFLSAKTFVKEISTYEKLSPVNINFQVIIFYTVMVDNNKLLFPTIAQSLLASSNKLKKRFHN